MTLLKFPTAFLGGSLLGWWRLVFLPCLLLGCIPLTSGRSDPTRRQWTACPGGRTHPPGDSGWGPRMHNGTGWGAGTSKGSTAYQTGKNPGSNNRPAFGRQKGRLITSQRPLVTWSGVKLDLSGLGSGVNVCETPLGIREVKLSPGNSHNQG
jgi:hypothetical protein